MTNARLVGVLCARLMTKGCPPVLPPPPPLAALLLAPPPAVAVGGRVPSGVLAALEVFVVVVVVVVDWEDALAAAFEGQRRDRTSGTRANNV